MSLDTDDESGEHERTMVVDPRKLKRPVAPSPAPAPAPVVPSKPWRPYTFRRLEKASAQESKLLERVKWLTPNATAIEALSSRLKSLFDTQVDFWLDSMRVLGPGELRRQLSEPTFLSVLAPGGHRGRAMIEVELSLAHSIVDTLLGGAGEAVGMRPLTDIEEGVASFVLLEALKALVPGMDPSLPKLRLEGVARGADEAVRLGEDGLVVMVQLHARLGSQEGTVRLFVPASVMNVMEPSQVAEQRRTLLRTEIEANLSRLATVRTWMCVQIGHAEISSGDLSSLRIKDVVLVDALSVRSDRGEAGTARLLLGLGRMGHLASEVFVENGLYHARITGVVMAEPGHVERATPSAADEAAADALGGEGESGKDEFTSPEGRNSQTESGDMDDNRDAGDLLGDIPLQISVELARVPVKADQLVSMRVGHVVELHRSPGEPVDLSVNGKVIARGELVEIEGQLGVRVLSLAG